MSWKMKKIGACKRRAGIIVIIVMSTYIVSGLRLFCADDFLSSLRFYGSNAGASMAAVSGTDSAQISAGDSVNLNAKGRTLPCSCKKKKKCPAIPRATITSNPTHRLSEFQRLANAECRDLLNAQVMSHRLFAGGDAPLLDSCSFSACRSFTPLALTCVLLI